MSKSITKNPVAGHIYGIIAVALWGISFAASGRCLGYMTASQLTTFRLVIAYLTLVIIYPRFRKPTGFVSELRFAFTGLAGILGFHYLTAYSTAHGEYSTAVILLALSPILSLVLLCVTGRKNRLRILHLVGFIVSFTGTVLVAINGVQPFTLTLDSWPTLAAAGACLCFAIYSVLMDGYSGSLIIAGTRRSVFWAMLASVPLMIFTDGFPSDIGNMLRLSVVGCLIIAGAVGCGLAYVMWGNALTCIGTDRLINYFYLIPPAALAFSVFVLRSGSYSTMAIAGAILCASGVIVGAIAG